MKDNKYSKWNKEKTFICQSTPRFSLGDTPPGRVAQRQDQGGDSLLYLNSNNSIENESNPSEFLTSYDQKAIFIVKINIEKFIKEVGIERVGFLTLTFADNVKDNKEASRRFNSLKTNFLGEHFGIWTLVKERQRRGAWHYHILIDCFVDILTGINFEEIAQGRYGSANNQLRNLWQILRENLPKYGFGRSELLPVKSNFEAMTKYLGKYIEKGLGKRMKADKGVRLFSAARSFVKSSPKIAWNSDSSKKWRKNLEDFAMLTGCCDQRDLAATYGKNWAYFLAQYIVELDNYTIPEIKRIGKIYSHWPEEPGQVFVNKKTGVVLS